MIHGERTNGKAHGVVNTKAEVVSKMLDLVGYKSTNNLSQIKVLEPSAGSGAFAIEILKRLYQSSQKFRFNFEEALQNIHLCELDEEISNQLIQNIQSYLESNNVYATIRSIYVEDFLQVQLQEKYDLIIGNPPYVRNENIPKELKTIYQSKYSTFTHRSDLYIPFFEKALSLLNCDGQLSYVCSNRWLKNQYGKNLRTLIAKQFHVKSIIDLEQADIFDEEVLGYPAITTITNSFSSSSSLYSEVFDLQSFLEFEQTDKNAIQLNLKTPNWFSFTFNGYSFEKYLRKIEDQSFKIGIGVATGRDAIFIGTQFQDQIESELLLPILTSKGVKSDSIQWQGKYIINPFDEFGKLIDLDKYPLAKAYFFKHKEELSKRHIAKKDQTKFYRTIDRINPKLLSQPKVILPDISGNRFIHVDKGDYYPHHNLYYIVGGSYEEMCLLASILMSNFIYEQLLHIGNKMKGGYPRWQSQNIKKLRVPILSSIPLDIKDALMKAYFNKDLEKINSIVTAETMETFEIREGQGVLFENQTEYAKINHDRVTINMS